MLCFKLQLIDNSYIDYLPREIEKANNCEMYVLDYFVSCFDGIYNLKERISKDLEISPIEIKKIYIGKSNQEYVYNLIDDNKYMNGVLDAEYNKFKYIRVVNEKDEKGFYQRKVASISYTCPNYIEMKEYLFKMCINNPGELLDNIYTSNSRLHEYLYRYSNSLKQDDKTFEEEMNINNLSDMIKKELTNYETFRSVASARLKYEKGIKYRKEETKKETIIENPRLVEPEYKVKVDDINNYDLDKEEYLEEEEISSMTDGENNLFVPKR